MINSLVIVADGNKHFDTFDKINDFTNNNGMVYFALRAFSGKYRIQSLSPQTFQGAMKVMRHAYVNDEYVSLANEVNKHPEAIEEFLHFAADLVLDGVSVVAVEIETGEVVSVCFNKLYTQDTTADFDKLSEERDIHPSTKGLLEFVAILGKKVDVTDIYKADCFFELLFLATLKQHRGRKLGHLCCKASVDLAKKLKDGPVSTITVQDLGPDYSELEQRELTNLAPKVCHIICTSVATQKNVKALNFTQHLRVSFTEFTYQGLTYVERNGFDPYCEVSALLI